MPAEELNLPSSVPHTIRERIETFADIGRERSAAVIETSARRRAAMSDLEKDRAALRELERSQRNGDQIAQFKARIERAEKDLAKLAAVLDRLTPSSQAARALTDRLIAYVRAQPSFSLHRGGVPQLQAGETARDGLERAARTKQKLLAELQDIEARPIPSAVAKRIAREQLAARIEAVRPDAGPLLNGLGEVKFPVMRLQQFGGATDVYGTDPVALLGWLLPNEMASAIDHEIDAIADDDNALTAEQRREKLAQTDASILASEREQAAYAELAGQLPPADTDPRAVLGLDGSMPAPAPARN